MLGLTLLLLAPREVSAGEPFPHTFLYASTRGGGAPLLNNDLSVNPGIARCFAKFQLLTMNTTPWCDMRPGVIDTVRALHPGPTPMVILAYDVYGQRFPFATPGTMWKAEYDAINRIVGGIEGSLFATDGTQFIDAPDPWPNLGRAFVDSTLDSLWTVNVVMPGKYDGVFFDFSGMPISMLSNGPPNFAAPDFARGGWASGAAMDNGRIAAVTNLAARMHVLRTHFRRTIVTGNGMGTDAISPIISEGSLCESWPDFRGFTAGLAFYRGQGPYATIASYCKTCTTPPPNPNNGTEYSATSLKEERFGLGSACMGEGYFNFSKNRDLPASGPGYLEWYYDEFSVDLSTGLADTSGAHTGWLGQALGPATQIAPDVWIRYFDNGAAVLNGSLITVTPTLEGSRRYRRIRGIRDVTTNNGSIETSPQVPPNDALFLLVMPDCQ
jgi:hypothetical protein